jgi:hypothetical protein
LTCFRDVSNVFNEMTPDSVFALFNMAKIVTTVALAGLVSRVFFGDWIPASRRNWKSHIGKVRDAIAELVTNLTRLSQLGAK